jgi:hypothetical protein
MGMGAAGLRWLAAACIAALVGGCSMSGDAKVAPTAAAADRASSGSVAVKCLDAGNLARGILANSRGQTELTVVEARAVRPPDAQDAFLIAIRFGGHPSESTGVWTSSSLDLGDDSVRSVDVGAVEVSQWPWSLVTEPKIATTDPGVLAAMSCL